jgi:predicted ATP-dependent endonuclease of OLD family
MLIRRISLQNVRSFLDKQDLLLDGQISILIGPNGGGKTNLLDAAVVMLRRYLFASTYAMPSPTPEQQDRYEFRYNDILNQLTFETHNKAGNVSQRIEIEVEVTQRDVDNMQAIKRDADRLIALAGTRYANLTLNNANTWDLTEISAEKRFVFRFEHGGVHSDGGPFGSIFLQYLQTFEMDAYLREHFDLAPLSTPMIYLPVNRSANPFQSSVQLASFNEHDFKRQNDATSSRSGTQIVSLAIGRLAGKYRDLLELDKGGAAKAFKEDDNIKDLTNMLRELGYEWNLVTIDSRKNHYDVQLTKQGSSFLVSAASSGERELLTYLFAIFALNVRDALIIVDEPELHLHPKWQKILLDLFVRLSTTTGNQFLLATHAPTFVSPQSIQYVSRVFSKQQKSQIIRLDTAALPESKHLFNIVNSQNNERIFFADRVILVEGISDRIFFEAFLDAQGRSGSSKTIVEVVSVGGKGFFASYGKILRACQIDFSIVADLDYVEQVGTAAVKGLFTLDTKEIKKDVIDNVGSMDGDALVARIDDAMARGTWDDAQEVWGYIKSRRRKLKNGLNEIERKQLDEFIKAKRKEGVFILSKGALEDYLPAGHKSKDLDKLIRLVSNQKFTADLSADASSELGEIAKLLLPDDKDSSAQTGPAPALI